MTSVSSSTQLQIRLGDLHKALNPHPGQREVLQDTHRYKILAAGRRWGKGTCAYQDATLKALTGPRGAEIWIVSPTHVEQESMWLKANEVLGGARHDLLVTRHNPSGKLIKRVYSTRGYRKLVFFNDAVLYFKSAKDPDSLRGAGDTLVYVVFDEAAYMAPDAWHVVRYSLIDRKAPCLFISTPNRYEPTNWFYRLWLRGQEWIVGTCPECDGDGCEACGATGQAKVPNPEHHPDYKSWRFSTYDNPWLPKEEADAVIRDGGFSPADIEREIYANFTDTEGAVFSLMAIQECEAGEFLPPQPQGRYVMGVDFGQVHDFTVAIILNLDTSHVDWMDRFQGSWNLQFERLGALYKRYNEPVTYVDATQLGGSMIEENLRRVSGINRLVGCKLNGPNKNRLIEGLRVAIESALITFPHNKQVRKELLAFSAQRLPSGHLRYEAAGGEFDDVVIAMALAWEAARSQTRVRTWVPQPMVLGEE